MNHLNGVQTYRWISAHEKQTVGYGLFLSPIPEGATGVSDVQLEGNEIVIHLTGIKEIIRLAVKKP
jgi:voltage-gated potassium channel Kch